MIELLFASGNTHKLLEIKSLADDRLIISGLSDIGIMGDLEESFATLAENSAQKAWFVYNQTGRNCFAEDSGLEIEALGGKPGVQSARYAGAQKRADDNMQKVLNDLKEVHNRSAQFRAVITLVLSGKATQFEGVLKGQILKSQSGTGGFGYDPIFRPDGFSQSLAELDLQQKNKISHRFHAFRKMQAYVLKLNQ